MNMGILFSFAQSNNQASDGLSSGKSGWKMGVALYSFNRFSFADALKKAESAGVKYVEGFSFHKLGEDFGDNTMATVSEEGITRMEHLLNKKGLKMNSMYVGGAKNAGEWKYFFEMAKDLGMQYLVSEPPRDQLDMVDSLAGLYGVKIAVHQHSKESGSIYWHPDSVLSAIKNHPNIGACGDLGHWARSGLDPVECLKKLEGHLLGLHLKDIDAFAHDANDVLVGTGVIDFPGVVRELERQDFSGMVYVECEHKMDNNLADVVQAVTYFRELGRKAGN
jgi:sugar phosphate isomerase/epimerase